MARMSDQSDPRPFWSQFRFFKLGFASLVESVGCILLLAFVPQPTDRMAEIAAINRFTQALRGGKIDDFYASGDELRQKLQQNGLIKDRSYRLKVSVVAAILD